jgi:hypothetical protein
MSFYPDILREDQLDDTNGWRSPWTGDGIMDATGQELEF